MEGLRTLFGESDAITLILIVLGLAVALVLLFWIFRKLARGNALSSGRNRQPRLSVTDAAVVDDKRRLVLVRRDNVEHLVMIGGLSDFVIEQNIATAQAAVQPEPAEEARSEPVIEADQPRPTRPPEQARPPEPARLPEEARPAARHRTPEPVPAPANAAAPAAGVGAGIGLAASASNANKPSSNWPETTAAENPATRNAEPDTRKDDGDTLDDLDMEFSELGEEIEAAASREARTFDEAGSTPPHAQSPAPPFPEVVETRDQPPVGGQSDDGQPVEEQKSGQSDSEMENEMQKLLNELAKA